MVAYSIGKRKFAFLMKYYQSPSFDPAYNLALEEFLFNKATAEYLLIYRNENSVVCGKHQNPVAEINTVFLRENNIPLHRRFSGGGTVFHDLGNINFSFITSGENAKVIDFVKYASSIVSFLKSRGIEASLSERNDILLNGKKITGHAAHSKSKRALHHGTLLFDANLSLLSNSLKSDKEKFKSRAVKSVPSPVTNLCAEHGISQDIENFIGDLILHLRRIFSINDQEVLDEKDLSDIHQLAESKYRDWEWNYAYGPAYTFEIAKEVFNTNLRLEIAVDKGIISNISFHESSTFDSALKRLIGKRHDYTKVFDVLNAKLDDQIAHTITNLFF